MKEKEYTEGGFPVLPKTLRNFFEVGSELRPINGQIKTTNSGKLIIGHLTDFDVLNGKNVDPSTVIVFDKQPTPESKIIIKKVNAYNLRVEVKSPE